MYYAALKKSNEIAIERKAAITELYTQNKRIEILDNWINEYERPSAKYLNHMYDASRMSIHSGELEKQLAYCGAYSSFEGSPSAQGLLQYDLWNKEPVSDRYDWTKLKQSIQQHGLRNSMLIAPMPTASTSQILGYNECFEPLTSNIYSRKTIAGEFIVVNKYLMNDLIKMGQWNEAIKNSIIANKGSVQHLTMLSQELRDKYKIVWEIPMKHIIDMAADRGAFICQSQSLNLWMEDPVYNKLTSMHFYSWEKGLKTGIYYLRRKAKHQAQQFTIEPERKKSPKNNNNSSTITTDNSEEGCTMCSA
jgi:ribonucleotide reductase alpha subunit